MSNVVPFKGPVIARAPIRLVPDPASCPAKAAEVQPIADAFFTRMLANFEAQCALAHVTKYGTLDDLKELREYIDSCIASKS